ncbi:MAG: RHS repeat-associated core domain-containing protein [Xanthomonadales bacterium]|nr:RHS repeat-associated core domain-containing protein [Xanthomonadales bacterium]MBK7144406.1 RHS repeat-associated core domain-containing protein [Xanthomonadales bacterium]
MLTRTQSGATLRFTYDLADRMLGTTRNNVLQATHVYDGNGLRTRTSKPAPGAPQPDRDLRFQIYTPSGVFQWENDIECSRLRSRGVNYVRLAGSLVAKVVADSTLTQAECYPGTSNSEQQTLSLNPFRNPFAGATEVVAGSDGGRDGEAPSAPTSTTTYSIVYVHTDALGSPVAETNTSATVISGSRTQYEPYGKPLTTPREGAPSYTGHQHDTSTGLIYAQQRYYDPALGRFLSTDPMAVDMGSAGNWNRYAYANNSPYRYFDPDGRCTGSHITNQDGTCKSSGGFTTESTRAWGGGAAGGRVGSGLHTPSAAAQIDCSECDEYAALNRRITSQQLETLKDAGWFAAKYAALEFGAGKLAKWAGKLGRFLRISGPEISFGRNANQLSHTFRHVEAGGLNREAVQRAVLADLRTSASLIQPGKPFNQRIFVGGKEVTYSAFLLDDGAINVGRITLPW